MRAPGASARAPAAATTSARHLRARRSSASPTGCWRRATHPSLRGRSSDIPAARTPTLRAPARRRPRLETDPERARHLHLVASRSGACRRPRSPLSAGTAGAPQFQGPRPPVSGPPRLGVRGTPCIVPPPQHLPPVLRPLVALGLWPPAPGPARHALSRGLRAPRRESDSVSSRCFSF